MVGMVWSKAAKNTLLNSPCVISISEQKVFSGFAVFCKFIFFSDKMISVEKVGYYIFLHINLKGASSSSWSVQKAEIWKQGPKTEFYLAVQKF